MNSITGAGRADESRGVRYQVGKPYVINGVRYVPRAQPRYDVVGVASWYGRPYHGRRTASGKIYDM